MDGLRFPDSDCSSDCFGFTRAMSPNMDLDSNFSTDDDKIQPQQVNIDSQNDEIQKCRDKIKENKWIVLNNVLNGLSWLVSPIIGVIRIILACKVREGADEEYFGGLLARGIAEIFCLGPLLMIVDLVITIFRYSNCSCCSKEFT